MALLRRRNKASGSGTKEEEEGAEIEVEEDDDKNKKEKKKLGKTEKANSSKKAKEKWSCVDSCCWLIGCICTIWWLLLFLYKAMPASFPQFVTEAITGPLPDPPGLKLRKEGLRAEHPVVFVPGIVTGGLELWEGHQCAEGLFRKRLWGGTFGEVYKRNESRSIEGFTDVDWVGSIEDKRSTSGYCTFVWGNLVTWRSKKQTVVARSSAEAHGISEMLWLKLLLEELEMKINLPLKIDCDNLRIDCDNKAAISISCNPVHHDQRKHAEVDRYFIKEKIEDGILCITYVSTSDQVADVLTKALARKMFERQIDKPSCWVEHMSLDNETGLDPPGVRVRPVSGLVAADYFAPGYFVWAVLIANLARVGYEEKNMYMAAYDWRLSFQNTEVRDQTLSRIKSNIELMVATNGGKKAVILPHSMGVLYFLHFMKWVEAPAPMGGGGGPDWCSKHIKAVINIGGPFLGVPKAVAGLFSAEAKDIAVARAIAPGFLDNDRFRLQTLQHVMRMTRTWDSTLSMIPKGGDTIWGGMDWSPEEGYSPSREKQRNNDTQFSQSEIVNYGRIISFGKDVAEAPSSEIERVDFRGAIKGSNVANTTCRDVWTEYHDMGLGGIRAVADHKVYTAESIIDLLYFVAPKMMARSSAHFSYGIADNLEDPKYSHYKYWSNPLETKLPNAPDMEIFSLYGVGIPTERAYIYESSPSAECYIPFQINTSANGDIEDSCLKDGVYTVDGDETVPVLSAGFMCAKGWRGKTRFNPSGIKTYIREYDHSPPSHLLEGRGTQSGAHVDIMGNFALIEDIIRVAAGAKGEDLGGDKVYSDIFKWSDKISLPL
ncbi:Phospholipid:diacylglycerol acyltransferase 1 [Morus notabilis]|uniref:phospholipid:diacylglycerol acyltransferase n=1 Tax=Morus notabilis TaxID=981085 RepID=W9QE24_9ROSA|nr:Phospholipid:diacylglycerol acyltransferase 1 [Morus notabilis]